MGDSRKNQESWTIWLGGRKWLDFNAGKTELVLFDWFIYNNTGGIDVKMDGSVLEKQILLKCWQGWKNNYFF